MEEGLGGIVEAEVSGYFDRIDRTRWREVLRQRVNEGRVMRLMGKWLRAGVMDDGGLQHPETAVVQGGVISPVLANIFLHHGLDDWVEREVQPRLTGRSFLTRFADDWIIGGALEADAPRLMAVLPKRFARFGLSLHPEKTVVIRVSKPTTRKGSGEGNGTVDFLGLPHYWTRSRRGYWVIRRRTARKRLRRTTKVLWRGGRANRHLPLKDQYRLLGQKLRGHFQYYGIQGNYRLLSDVRQHAEEAWRYWLSRHSHKSASSWEKFQKLKAVFGLPIPKSVHQI